MYFLVITDEVVPHTCPEGFGGPYPETKSSQPFPPVIRSYFKCRLDMSSKMIHSRKDILHGSRRTVSHAQYLQESSSKGVFPGKTLFSHTKVSWAVTE